MFPRQSLRRCIVVPRRFCSSEAVVPANEAAVAPRRKRGTRHSKTLVFEPLNVYGGVDRCRELAWAKFDESVEISVNLGVDPRKANQSVKGVAILPHGTGKKVRVGVFAKGVDAEAAVAAGADFVGTDELIAKIQGGEVPFDRIVATPDMMPLVSKVGRILGPRGLMPNPKLGTVTKDVGKAVVAAKAGTVQFRVERHGIVQAGIGRVSFPPSKLLDNIRAFMVAVSDSKPEVLKGKYILSVSVSSTMGPGIPIELATVDPSNPKFMLDPSKLGDSEDSASAAGDSSFLSSLEK